MNALVDLSYGMWTVKLCSKLGMPANI